MEILYSFIENNSTSNNTLQKYLRAFLRAFRERLWPSTWPCDGTKVLEEQWNTYIVTNTFSSPNIWQFLQHLKSVSERTGIVIV